MKITDKPKRYDCVNASSNTKILAKNIHKPTSKNKSVIAIFAHTETI